MVPILSIITRRKIEKSSEGKIMNGSRSTLMVMLSPPEHRESVSPWESLYYI
jgi:hypothetical protein